MRIIILTRFYPSIHRYAGGMETHAKLLAETMVQKGHDVHVIISRSEKRRGEIAVENGVVIHITDSWIKYGLLGTWWWKSLAEIRAIEENGSVDCVISQGTAGYSYLASSGVGHTPCVFVAHGDVRANIVTNINNLPKVKSFFAIIKWSLFYLIERVLLSRVAAIVAITPVVAEEYKRLYPKLVDKIFTVANSIDTKEFRPAAKEASRNARLNNVMTFVYVGRIIRMKGIFVLLESFKRLRGQSVKLILAGDGDDLENVKIFIEENNMHSYVEVLGRKNHEELPAIYNLADVAIFPTLFLSEGLPFTVIEAMSCGLPCICSDVRGFREVVQDSGGGWLVPAGSIDELFTIIKTTTEEKETVEAMKKRVREFVTSRFDLEANTELFLNIVRKLVKH